MKKVITTITITLLFKSLLFAQTYELSQVRQMPFVDETNMKTIAFSVQKLFDDAIKEPEKNSTVEAVDDNVYVYYDIDGNRNFKKIELVKGNQYTPSNILDLKKDNCLLFNLIFDVNGNLIVPNSIHVIFNRNENQGDTLLKRIGLLAFSLKVTDSIKSVLSKVKLQRLAKISVNSLTHTLNPVQIKIPFTLSYTHDEPIETTGTVMKNNSELDVSIDRNFRPEENKDVFVDLIKKQTEILDYKKGTFKFSTIENKIHYYIDFNIAREGIISAQTMSFYALSEKKITSFSGNGKKIKK